MPRYFFHTTDGSREIDDQGLDLADDEAARREAVRFGASLLSEDPDIIGSDHGLRIEVVDDRNRLSFAVIILAVNANWQDAQSQPFPAA